jgi:hypothetical protein
MRSWISCAELAYRAGLGPAHKTGQILRLLRFHVITSIGCHKINASPLGFQ